MQTVERPLKYDELPFTLMCIHMSGAVLGKALGGSSHTHKCRDHAPYFAHARAFAMRMLIDIVGVVVIEHARVMERVGSPQCVLALLNEFITPVSSLWRRNLERGECSSPLSPPLEPPLHVCTKQ